MNANLAKTFDSQNREKIDANAKTINPSEVKEDKIVPETLAVKQIKKNILADFVDFIQKYGVVGLATWSYSYALVNLFILRRNEEWQPTGVLKLRNLVATEVQL